MVYTHNDSFLSLNQNINQFLIRRWLNLKSFIQPSEILLVKLIETYKKKKKKKSNWAVITFWGQIFSDQLATFIFA